MRPIIVIPSRLASTRLARKPLADIAGAPMIVHVARRAVQAEIGPVVVASGDAEILDVLSGLSGIVGVLTDPALPSGSDRVHAAISEIDPSGEHDVVINLQGDLPLVDPASLPAVLEPLHDPAYQIGTLAAPIRDRAERDSPQVVKIACDFGPAGHERPVARGLYFSRFPIPSGEGPYWHHVGIYSWRRAALDRFVTLPQTGLEKRENLEQLRALEDGMAIGCARIGRAPHGVDTQADLERVRSLA